VATPAVDLGDVIDFYNKALTDLPDHTKLKGLKLPGASVVLDRKGERFAEVFEENQRRVWVLLAEIPAQVQKAFVAAEDKRFYEHRGIDERGLIRAFIANLANSGRPQKSLKEEPPPRSTTKATSASVFARLTPRCQRP
jgi:penicillin-binding protein 1A